MNISLMLSVWNPSVWIDADLNLAYLASSNVVQKHLQFICDISDDPAGVIYVEKLLRMWSHPSGKSHTRKNINN